MWERQFAIEALDLLLKGVRDGHGATLFLVGDAGFGKTALLNEAVRQARAAGVEVVQVGASPVECGLPYALVSQVLDALGMVEQVQDGTAADHLHRVREWLQRWDRPLLVAVDDLQWADNDSLIVLSYLARRLGGLPVGLVATLRPWPAEAFDVSAGLEHDGYARSMSLQPLTEVGTAAFLAERTSLKLSESSVHTGHTLTAGNPLLLTYLASMLVEGADMPQLDTPPDVVRRRLLLRRFTDLSATGTRLVQAGAVLGVRFRPAVAVELAGLAAAEGDMVLDGLLRRQMLCEAPGRQVEFAHPLIRQLLYEDLPTASRLRLHARAFTLLDRQDRQAEAAEHAVLGDMTGDERAVEVLTQTGRAAFAAGALSTAVRHLCSAREFASDAAGIDLLLLTGRALLAAGRADDAVVVLDAASGGESPRAEVVWELGRASYPLGRYDNAAMYFARAVELARVTSPEVAVAALLDQATVGHLHGAAAALESARQALELADQVDPTTRRRAQSVSGYLTCLNGDGAGIDAVAEAAREVAADPTLYQADLSWGWGALSSYAFAAKWFERFEDSEQYFSLALAAAERIGVTNTAGLLFAARGELYMRTGRLDAAQSDVARAFELSDLNPMVRRYTNACKTLLLTLLDRWDECEPLCGLLEAEAEPIGDLGCLLIAWWVQGRIALNKGDAATACDRFTLVEQTSHRAGFREPCVFPWQLDAITAYVRAGRQHDVLRMVAWLDTSAERLPCVWPRAIAAFGRALTAANTDETEHWFDRSVSLQRQVGQPAELAETLLAEGEWMCRAGRLREARVLIAEALEIAERIGFLRLERRARQELTRAGGRRRRTTPSQLTPAEKRVADLAAAGCSNAEIASNLTVAVSTVASHLQRVYSKLGVRNRRELMLRDRRDSNESTS